MKPRFDFVKMFSGLAVLTAIVCWLSIGKRIEVEKSNRSTMLVAEVDTIQSLAAAQGLTFEDGLRRLKAKGLNGMVVPEDTVGSLITEGRAELSGISVGTGNQVRSLIFPDSQTVERVTRGLRIRYGDLVKTIEARDNRLALPPVDATSLRSTAIGLDPQITSLAKKEGLGIIARCSNPVGVTSKAVRETVVWAHDLGATVFLAQGEQVLGRRDSINATVEALTETKMTYASPEFAKLGGDDIMLGKMGAQCVRLHSAQAAELDKLSLGAAIERYRKAASERNMRILLFRGISNASDAPLDSFGDFLASVSTEIQADGLNIGVAAPFSEPGVSKGLKIAIGFLAGLCGLLVTVRWLGERKGLIIGAGVVAIATVGATREGTLLQLSALLLSLVFPVGAFFLMTDLKLNAWFGLIIGAVVAMFSGLCVAGLLNGVEYYIRAETFPGVKLSVFGPVLLLGVVGFGMFNDLKTALKDPITWGSAALGLVILGVIGLIMIRTGNDNPAAVSGGEMAFRGLLEQLLPVRPRSKEFLLAFPALFIGLSMLKVAKYDKANLGRAGGWIALTLMLGAVGLTDMVNTLCHLHTPVMISIIRNLEGIVLGGIIGQVVWLVIQKPAKRLMEMQHG